MPLATTWPTFASGATTLAAAAVTGDAVLALIGAILTAGIAALGYVRVAQIQRTGSPAPPRHDPAALYVDVDVWEEKVAKAALWDQHLRQLGDDQEP